MFLTKVDNKDIAFIHLFKCAGMSIYFSLKDENKLLEGSKVHSSIYDLPNKPYRNISLVRNPEDFYRSLINYEIWRIKNVMGVNLISRFMLFDNWEDRENRKLLSFDTILNNMLNFKEFMKNNPKYVETLNSILTINNKKHKKHFHMIRDIYKNYNVNKPEFAETFLQEFVNRFGINDTEFYRMEDQIDDVVKILDIDKLQERNIGLNNTNSISNSDIKRIQEKDSDLYQRWGYDKKIF